MSLQSFISIFRRWWLLLIGLPLLVAIISLITGFTTTPRYESTARLIVTRGVTDPNSTAGMTWAREDTVAQDLPTIISSAAFARDVDAALQRQGAPTAALTGSGLHATNDGKIVTISASAATPEAAQARAAAAIGELQANGLRYWGDPTWTPEHPGVNIGALDPPAAASAIPSRRQVLLDTGLRAMVGLIVAIALAAGLGRRDTETRRQDEFCAYTL